MIYAGVLSGRMEYRWQVEAQRGGLQGPALYAPKGTPDRLDRFQLCDGTRESH
jgi:hypothetical protein